MTTEAQILRYFEFAEENVPGTAETTPEMSCDVKSIDAGIPSNPDMDYPGSMGRGKTKHRPGFYSTSPSVETGVDLKILARMLYFATGKRIVVTGEGDGNGNAASKVLQYDESTDTFTDITTSFNNITASDVTIPGHAAGEVDDYIAIGSTEQFNTVMINTATAKTDVSTIVWEYWDGTAWKTLTVTDSTTGFTVTGAQTVTFTAPNDWVKKSLNNGVSYYYVRARCSAFTSAGVAGLVTQGTVGTAPDTSTEYIYASNGSLLPSFTGWYGIDIDASVIPGCVIDSFELDVEDEFITIKCDMAGMQDTPTTLKSKSELKENDDYPLAFFEVNMHMREKGSSTPWGAATLISEDIKKLAFKIKNSAKAEDGQSIGNRFPNKIPVGEREIGFTFDYDYLTTKWYDLMQGGSGGPSTNASTEFEVMLEIDADEYGNAQIFFPCSIVSNAPKKADGRSANKQSVEVTAYQENITVPTTPTQTVYSELLATFVHNFSDTTASFDGPSEFASA